MTSVILVRHGQTEWNRDDRFRGRADLSLDTVGAAQATATAQRIAATWRPSAIYSSPLRRAVQTAEAIADPLGLGIQTLDGLIDIDYGEWQGMTVETVRQRWPDALELWLERPEAARPPGGETLGELRSRAAGVLKAVSTRHADQTVVLAGHTVINRIILLIVLGLGNHRFWHLAQDTCAINVFETRHDDFRLVLLNDTCHLRHIS